MAKFIMIRHGEPRYDEVESREYFGMGRELGKLTLEGEKQAYERAQDEELKDAEIIIASPYTRALQTAAIISRITNIPLTVENDLHEWLPDTSQKYNIENWKDLWETFRSTNGDVSKQNKYNFESYEVLKSRVLNVLKQYKHYNKVIVVCHGIVISTQTYFDDHTEFCGKRIIELE